MVNSKDECLNREWFINRQDAKRIIEEWRIHYNTERSHSALGYQPPQKVSGRHQVA
ncbi:MAG: transposase [Campylobacterales bacterium]